MFRLTIYYFVTLLQSLDIRVKYRYCKQQIQMFRHQLLELLVFSLTNKYIVYFFFK